MSIDYIQERNRLQAELEAVKKERDGAIVQLSVAWGHNDEIKTQIADLTRKLAESEAKSERLMASFVQVKEVFEKTLNNALGSKMQLREDQLGRVFAGGYQITEIRQAFMGGGREVLNRLSASQERIKQLEAICSDVQSRITLNDDVFALEGPNGMAASVMDHLKFKGERAEALEERVKELTSLLADVHILPGDDYESTELFLRVESALTPKKEGNV